MKVEVEVEKCQLTQNRAPNGYAIDNDAIQIRPRQRIASVAVPSMRETVKWKLRDDERKRTEAPLPSPLLSFSHSHCHQLYNSIFPIIASTYQISSCIHSLSASPR
jgi:hypothetical protein